MEKMTYQELLGQVGKYGHGVFSLTMLSESKDRHALKMFVTRHSDLFCEYKGTHGDIKLIKLTPAGFRYFGVHPKPSRPTTTWESLLDMALFNAYMVEVGEYASYSNKPHVKLTIGSRRIGLISNRWGVTREMQTVDVLLATERKRIELLSNKAELEKLSARERISLEDLVEKIDSAKVPKAFCNLR